MYISDPLTWFSSLCFWFYSTAISFQKVFSAYLMSQTKSGNIHPVTFQSLKMSVKSSYFRMIHFAIVLPMSYEADMSQNNSVPHAICSHWHLTPLCWFYLCISLYEGVEECFHLKHERLILLIGETVKRWGHQKIGLPVSLLDYIFFLLDLL